MRHIHFSFLLISLFAISSNCDTTSPAFLRLLSASATNFGELLGSNTAGRQLLRLTGAPTCGVDVYDFQYLTLGQAGERTNASGAIMLPTGSTGCTGPRPILLYAHGTSASRGYNFAVGVLDPASPAHAESTLVAAMYAAQGFIVVASNYAGYDDSLLPYHPYLNASQQAGEMIDALKKARLLIPTAIGAPVSDNGKLLLSGYSQGAFVAMATMREMQSRHLPVTAMATGSGPYALEWFGDAIFSGNVDLGSTLFAPFLATSYQHAYGNIYNTPTDLFSPQYATGIEFLLPSYLPTNELYDLGLLPKTALFNSTTPTVSDITNAGVPSVLAPALADMLTVPTTNPIGALGFGPNYLINNSARIAYAFDAVQHPDVAAMPTNPLRRAFWVNDLRNGNWAPTSPMFLCGGHRDPTVFFNNTTIMHRYWNGLVNVYDVDPGNSSPADALQAGFLAAINGLSQSDLLQKYHGALLPPFCAAASRTFFQNFL